MSRCKVRNDAPLYEEVHTVLRAPCSALGFINLMLPVYVVVYAKRSKMWARLWCFTPAERPAPFTPPPAPPAPPQYGPPPKPSSFAALHAIAGDFLDRGRTAVLSTAGPTCPCVTATSSAPSARRAVAELTAPASDASPAAPQKNDPWTLSSQAVHWIIAAAVVVGVVLALCVVALLVRRRRRRRRHRRPVEPPQLPSVSTYHKDGPALQQAPSEHYFAQQHRPSPPQTSGTFSDAGSDHRHAVDVVAEMPAGGSHAYEQLAAATGGFSPGNVVGQGGFGCVYRGRLDGGEVAVKKLKTESRQGDSEFRAEVEIISRVHHRNLVTLVGYCIYSSERLLVYEFVPNKTLWHSGPPLDWHQRWKIAGGSARGLAYLHDDCYPKIIHRDVKASNILLDSNFEPKVADFGLAKYQPRDHTHVSTRVMGTFGYIAPEFLSSGKLTDKADVFAFGVVLLELIQSSQSYMDDTLVGWILKYLQGEMRADDPNYCFKITSADDLYSSGMDSGESTRPRPRRTQRSQGNASNDYSNEQASGDKPNCSGW
ncbi:hypothetical protein ACP4OV_002535 [Aristida adscensionis]